MKKGSFVSKVIQILNDPSWSHLIRWKPNGDAFVVVYPEEFARTVLPKYFKHSNFSSFVRQLHLYGFKKSSGSSNATSNVVEFSNKFFLRGREDLLSHIKRRAATRSAIVKNEENTNENKLVDSLRMQLDELKEQNRMLTEDNRSLRMRFDAFGRDDSEFQKGPMIDAFLQAGNLPNENIPVAFPGLSTPATLNDSRSSSSFGLPELTRHPSFDRQLSFDRMEFDSDMHLDLPEQEMFTQDYASFMEAGEMFYPAQDDFTQLYFGMSY